MRLNGRRKIYTSADRLTADNIVQEVNKVIGLHCRNFMEIEYLYWYRRGVQPILNRTKEIRPEICNRVVINNAEEVVSFKNGYFLTRPATYISRKDDDTTVNKVKKLNEYIYAGGKHDADNEVVDWIHTVGVGVMYICANENDSEWKEKPIECYALDPRSAFVVYSYGPKAEPVMGINMVTTGDDEMALDVFTKDNLFHLRGSYAGSVPMVDEDRRFTCSAIAVESVESNPTGEIPIIEYTYNSSRMSAFEKAIDIMDAINLVESNRIDGIEQTVQNLLIAVNCQFEEDTTANKIRQAGMVQIKSTNDNKADLKTINEVLDQSQTQTTLDNLYAQMLHKCAMPDTTKGGSSTSDTGTAVYLRDGYQIADTDARNTTDLFIKANRLFDKCLIKILEVTNRMKIKLTDFELKIERNSTSNLLVKTQAALNMKELGLAPQICFERSGLSNDPLQDMEVSNEYMERVWKKGSQDSSEVVPGQESGFPPAPINEGEDGNDNEARPVEQSDNGDSSAGEGNTRE